VPPAAETNEIEKTNHPNHGKGSGVYRAKAKPQKTRKQPALEATINERDMIRAERERERRQMQEQIENLQSSLATAQEQGSKALLLLTNQTGEKQGDQGQGTWL
jgi:hypothetical protein